MQRGLRRTAPRGLDRAGAVGSELRRGERAREQRERTGRRSERSHPHEASSRTCALGTSARRSERVRRRRRPGADGSQAVGHSHCPTTNKVRNWMPPCWCARVTSMCFSFQRVGCPSARAGRAGAVARGARSPRAVGCRVAAPVTACTADGPRHTPGAGASRRGPAGVAAPVHGSDAANWRAPFLSTVVNQGVATP